MGGVDRQIGDLPDVVVVGKGIHPLLDGVLVATRERRVDEVAGVGMAGVHRQPVAVLGHGAQPIDVTDVELRIDALAEQVHRQRHHIDVAGALPVPEQRALDAIGAGHHAELGGRDGGAAVVVRMQAQHHPVALGDVTVEVLDDIAVDVGRVHLDRGRQVQDEATVDARLDDIHHRCADLDRVVDLGAGEALG